MLPEVGIIDHTMDMRVRFPELLKASGTAFSNDIRSTPTYLVNGVMLDPGEGGKGLEEYVAGLVK